jgi:putative endonuclease
MRERIYSVYILTSRKNGTLYTGVTNHLIRHVYEHKSDMVQGFTKKYHVHSLVYYESTTDVRSAIAREKQLKKWRRAWKIALSKRIIRNGEIYILRSQVWIPH